jgi:hypothetical protein
MNPDDVRDRAEAKAQRFRDYADSADRQCAAEVQKREQAEARIAVLETGLIGSGALLRRHRALSRDKNMRLQAALNTAEAELAALKGAAHNA